MSRLTVQHRIILVSTNVVKRTEDKEMDIQNRDDKEDKTEYTHSPTYAVLAVRKSCDPRN